MKMSCDSELGIEESYCDSNNEISFDLNNVYSNLTDGLIEDDDIDLTNYLKAYKELYNFFVLLGGAFQFVASDIKSKIEILENLQSDEKKKTNKLENFSSVKYMILYEKKEELLKNQKYVSGSRTLLRLHRGLDFVIQFLRNIYQLEDNVKIGGVCREAYDKSLANYHTWVVKNSARLAMKLLPTREILFKKMSNNDPEKIEKSIDLMPIMLDTMKVAYDRVQSLYCYHKLLDLP